MAPVNFTPKNIVTQGFKAQWGIGTSVYTRQTTDLDTSVKADKVDASTWGTRFKNDLPGLQEGTTKITGMHSAVRGQPGDTLPKLVGKTTPVYAWNALESLNALAPIGFGPVRVMEYSPKSKMKDAVQFDTELSAAGAMYSGFILVSPKSITQLATTGTGLDDDSTSTTGATSFGGNIQAHFYDVSGGTAPSVTVVVQHSPDGTTWTTLASFVAVTDTTVLTPTVATQSVDIPSTTTVNAHVRAQWTTTGTPTSVQALIMYDRGVDPDS